MADVYLPRSLVDLFPGSPRRVSAEAPTVQALLRELDQRWPGMWDRLCDAGPEIRKHINLFVDGDKASLHTELAPSTIVRIIPAISGG